MGRGRSTPMEVHLIIVRLSDILRKEEISYYTGIPLRTVERILAYFHRTGTIKALDPRYFIEPRKSRRHLTNTDIQVSLFHSHVYALFLPEVTVSFRYH